MTLTQSGEDKSLSISPSANQSATSSSGNGSISVTSNTSWTVSSSDTWLTITSASSGSNNGTISYSYTKNSSTNPRSATITVSGSGIGSQTITLTQSGEDKSLSISPSANQSATSSSGNGSISVTSNTSWTVSSSDTWLTITSASSGSNNGTISYSYTKNSSTNPRSATITVSGSGVGSQTMTLIQSGEDKSLSINPSGNQSATSNSGNGSISVTSNTSWTVSSSDTWLTITSASSGSNNGTISYSYTKNSSTNPRSATITVSGSGVGSQTMTLIQSESTNIFALTPTQSTPTQGVVNETTFSFEFFITGGSGSSISGNLVFIAPDNNTYLKDMSSTDNIKFIWSNTLMQVGTYHYYYQAIQDSKIVTSNTYTITVKSDCLVAINDYIYGPYSGTDCGSSNNLSADKWGFYKYQCVSWVAWRLVSYGLPFYNTMYGSKGDAADCSPASKNERFSNACRWDDIFSLHSVSVDQNPSVNSIAHWDSNENGVGSAGHVGWVECVNGNIVTISNYNGWDGSSYTYKPCNYGVFTIDISKPYSRTNPKPGRYIHTEIDGLGEGLLSVEELSNNDINIFPNPVSNKLTISYNYNNPITHFQVIDLMGKLRIESNLNINNSDIDLSSLSNGIYFIRLFSKEDVSVYKIIKE